MARAIDADALQELCDRRIQDTWNSGTAPVSWAHAYADFKDDIDSMPTLTPPNEPLMLDELREMDGEPVYVVSAIGERPEWYIVDIEENEFKNPGDSISLENCDEGYPYTAYRRPPEKEEDT